MNSRKGFLKISEVRSRRGRPGSAPKHAGKHAPPGPARAPAPILFLFSGEVGWAARCSAAQPQGKRAIVHGKSLSALRAAKPQMPSSFALQGCSAAQPREKWALVHGKAEPYARQAAKPQDAQS